jgi:hypothetical protein
MAARSSALKPSDWFWAFFAGFVFAGFVFAGIVKAPCSSVGHALHFGAGLPQTLGPPRSIALLDS